MQKSVLALASLALFSIVTGTVDSAPQSGVIGAPTLNPNDASCENPWRHEPLLVYDVSGASFAGPLSIHLAVYNDGSVVFTRFFLFQEEREAEAVRLAPEIARALLRDLRDAAAFQLCDQPAVGSDVALKTLTVFGGATEARAHTTSWWFGTGAYGSLESILQAFLDEHFPSPPVK